MSSKRDREKLRGRVRAALQQAGRTQKELESEAGWSAGTLSRVYAGKKAPDREFLLLLAERLGVPLDALVEGTAYAAEIAVEPSTPSAAPPVADASVAAAPVAVAPAAPAVEPAAPAVEAAAAPTEPEPARPAYVDPVPPPEPRPEPPRSRKRDIPFRLMKWVVAVVIGD